MADYVTSRHLVNPKLSPKHGMGLEYGWSSVTDKICPFYVDEDQFNKHLVHAGGGLMEFLLASLDYM